MWQQLFSVLSVLWFKFCSFSSLLRSLVGRAACSYGISSCVTEASRLFSAWMEDPQRNRSGAITLSDLIIVHRCLFIWYDEKTINFLFHLKIQVFVFILAVSIDNVNFVVLYLNTIFWKIFLLLWNHLNLLLINSINSCSVLNENIHNNLKVFCP